MTQVAPPAAVVEAFGGDAWALAALTGGQGTSWRAGEVVLKPAGGADQIAWVGQLLEQVADGGEFRLARPLRSADRTWIVDGWAATGWVEGEHRPGRWGDIMQVSAAVHAALASVRVPAMPARHDPWAIGCRVAWGERVDWQPSAQVAALLAELAPRLDEPWSGPAAQIVHGDLGGNVVFADGLPPAVIDFSPHRAPAPFADAVIVADAMAWEDAPREVGEQFVRTRSAGAQLLARAVVFRVVAADGLAGGDEARVRAEVDAYRAVMDIALGR